MVVHCVSEQVRLEAGHTRAEQRAEGEALEPDHQEERERDRGGRGAARNT